MTARQLFQTGQLDEAIEALGVEVRDNPTDAQRRAFLFELLCFAGNFDRAEKQLAALGRGSHQAELGALMYHAAIHADRLRQKMFEDGAFPSSMAGPVRGTINGRPFESISDADPRIGNRLEVFSGGQYIWLPFQHLQSVKMDKPSRLRDLLWAPAVVRPAENFKALELGEALLPVVAPLTWQETDGPLRLGRTTEWREAMTGEEVPVGQKLLLVYGEEFPILELRELEIAADSAPSS
jgi:type VI secretion system protein ImpE